MEHTIDFHPDGTVSGLHTDRIPLQELGKITSCERVSNVELNTETQEWEVTLTDYGARKLGIVLSGEVIFSHADRQACLDWERELFQSGGETLNVEVSRAI